MTLLIALHAALALAAFPVARAIGRRVFLVCALGPAAAFVWILVQMPALLDGEVITTRFDWIPDLDLVWSFRVDAFAGLMVMLISGIGVLVFVYAAWYFGAHTGRIGGFASALIAFAGAMLGLVTADDVLLIFTFWELTSITSFLLIGFENERGAARGAALRALLVTGAGGLVLLAGFVMLQTAAGTGSLAGIIDEAPSGGVVTAGLMLVLVGAFTKSAQVPFHFWLPGAMAAPTPVSAFLHSATMVTAGVYLIARLAPTFALTPGWRPTVFVVGGVTALVGSWRALRQHDLKLLLAFGTVSALGFMVVLFGSGEEKLVVAGVIFLIAHACYKAALFLSVGVIDHQTHTRDIRRLTGVTRAMPIVAVSATVAALSMAGIPLTLGFLAKETMISGWEKSHIDAAGVMLVALSAASILTVAYSARFVWGAFATKTVAPTSEPLESPIPPPAPTLTLPAAVLGVVTLLTGIVWPPVAGFVLDVADSLVPDLSLEASELNPHLGPALAISGLIILLGLGLFAITQRASVELDRVPQLNLGERAYARTIVGLNLLADRTTAIVQNGSLPTYMAVILVTVVVFPGGALLLGTSLPDDLTLAESPMQAGVAGLVIAVALATTIVHRRFYAVLCLGGVGFGVSVLFVIQGAPDLALTQLLVETLSVFIFVAVLRQLPFEFPTRRRGKVFRLVLASLIGVFGFVFVLVAVDARQRPSVSEEHIARSVPEGGGRNVVNVTLVDFRGFDTFGEITVLVTMGIGVASLITAGRIQRRRAPRAPDEASSELTT